jgi:hypothetical protein
MAYVKFELKDGSTVYIESADLPKGVSGLIPPEKGQDHAEPAEVPFHQAIEAVSKMSVEMLDGLRAGFLEPPSDLSISFGLKASADLGSLFISRSGMEANFNVSLSWHKEGKEEGGEEAAKGKAGEVKEEEQVKAAE